MCGAERQDRNQRDRKQRSPCIIIASVRLEAVPRALHRITASGPTWDMDGDTFLLRVPGLARILISGGRDMSV